MTGLSIDGIYFDELVQPEVLSSIGDAQQASSQLSERHIER